MLGKLTRKSIACAVSALLAAPAMAAEPHSLSEYLGDWPTHINNSHGRRVHIVRGQAEDVFPEELSDPPRAVPESIDENWHEPWDTGGQRDPAVGDYGPPCQDCGRAACRCTPFWAHRTHVYGDFLYLLPSNADMAHAFQQNGVGGSGTVPAGSVGVLQPDFTSAYRTGFGVALGCYASINLGYSRLDSNSTDVLAALQGTGDNVQSLVLHPNSINAGSTSSLVNATLAINYQLADIEYRRLLRANHKHAFNYSVGARYGKLHQGFQQIGDFTPPIGTIQTTTDINFEGVGLRAGLDGEHRIGRSRFASYGKLFMNVLFGEFNSTYTQLNTTTTVVQAFSTWKDRRVLPLLEYELGLNWTSRGGHWRASAGYYTGFWFNTITTGQFVQAVQTADFVDLGETISFNGFVTRLEFRR